MRSHSSILLPRMIRAGLTVHQCRYRVVAAGLDHRLRIISIRTNTPRLPLRGLHAEERILHTSPRSLSLILLARVGADGSLLPITPCPVCARLAAKRGVRILDACEELRVYGKVIKVGKVLRMRT